MPTRTVPGNAQPAPDQNRQGGTKTPSLKASQGSPCEVSLNPKAPPRYVAAKARPPIGAATGQGAPSGSALSCAGIRGCATGHTRSPRRWECRRAAAGGQHWCSGVLHRPCCGQPHHEAGHSVAGGISELCGAVLTWARSNLRSGACRAAADRLGKTCLRLRSLRER